MNTDATTKLLLAAVAGGLWTLALRPALAPQPANAQLFTQQQQPLDDSRPIVMMGNRGLYIVEKGRIYRYVETLGQPVDIGEYGPHVRPRKED